VPVVVKNSAGAHEELLRDGGMRAMRLFLSDKCSHEFTNTLQLHDLRPSHSHYSRLDAITPHSKTQERLRTIIAS
jgi:hypothetical protein